MPPPQWLAEVGKSQQHNRCDGQVLFTLVNSGFACACPFFTLFVFAVWLAVAYEPAFPGKFSLPISKNSANKKRVNT
jgi:hypothetical protein